MIQSEGSGNLEFQHLLWDGFSKLVFFSCSPFGHVSDSDPPSFISYSSLCVWFLFSRKQVSHCLFCLWFLSSSKYIQRRLSFGGPVRSPM